MNLKPLPASLTLLGAAILVLAQACNSAPDAGAEAQEVPLSPDSLVANTPVAIHGPLHVSGTRLVDACERPVKLSGVSHFWHTWEGKEQWNGEAVAWLRDDWRVSLVRAPLAAHPGVDGDYLTDPEGSMRQLRDLVEGAIREGVYVIVDFHAHHRYPQEAREVLGAIAEDYGDTPNVIYAIWNEPVGTQANPDSMWRDIKAYAAEVIPAIRAHDPDNVIVVPTPFYDQFPDVAALDPITEADLGLPATNLMYDIHAYAGQHKKPIRDRADSALARGLPLIMTEIGRVGVDWGPGNRVDSASFDEWVEWVDRNGISFTKWSLSYRDERSSSLRPGASGTGGWTDDDLTDEGKFNRAFFRERGESFYRDTACGRGE